MTASAQIDDVSVETGAFDNNWESLSAWECPEWFKDAKFGIWAHWGPQCQAEDGDLTKADGTGKWWEGYDPQELYAQNHSHSTGWDNSGTIHSQWAWGKVSVTTEITDGKLNFGVELKSYQSNDCKFDHFTLEYLGAGSTGIDATPLGTGKSVESIYDPAGRRLARPVKGLNIVNGRKVIL